MQSDPEQPEQGLKTARKPVFWVATIAAAVVVTALVLHLMGRTPIAESGNVKLWHGQTISSENSQHISDWYSPSHVVHGFLFYGFLWLLARNRPVGFRALAATVIEAGWEIIENNEAVIERYRGATIALDYFGDSILNSVCDIGFMLVGFALAWRMPLKVTIAAAVLLELFVGAMIRDNLTLNVIMLLWPLDFIREWQSVGG